MSRIIYVEGGFVGGKHFEVDDAEWNDKVHEIFFGEVVASALAGVDDLRETLNLLVEDPRVQEALEDIYKEDAVEAFRQEWERSQEE